jgi:hypothetical protein
MPQELCEEFEQLSLGFLHHTLSASFEAEPTIEAEIRQHQKEDKMLQDLRSTEFGELRQVPVRRRRESSVPVTPAAARSRSILNRPIQSKRP